MPNLFRSEEMQKVQLLIPTDAARNAVADLGELGLVQLKDLNPDVSAFQRNFVTEVKKYDEMERKLTFFRTLLNADTDFFDVAPHASSLPLVELESYFEELEKDVREIVQRDGLLTRQQNELKEHMYVLQMSAPFLGSSGRKGSNPATHLRLADDDGMGALGAALIKSSNEVEMGVLGAGGAAQTKDVSVGYLTGVIPREKLAIFERVIFRAIRGNVYIRFADVDELLVDPSTGTFQKKVVFIIFYSGQRSETKISKVCDAFSANRYTTPQNPEERAGMIEGLRRQADELSRVQALSNERRNEIMVNVAAQMEDWTTMVHKEKMTYHALNMFNYDNRRKMLIGEGWTPKDSVGVVAETLRHSASKAGSQLLCIVQAIEKRPRDVPPTWFRTGKFFRPFQSIVDTYGVARYREFNPAVFTVITFPFLFGVMFGDVGHGGLLLLASLYLVYKEKDWGGKKLDDNTAMIFNGRFLLLLMSLFSIYCGTIYNDYFALGLDFTFSSDPHQHGLWKWGPPEADGTVTALATGGTYAWGMDPMWKGAKNMLVFMNSFKMKSSVILGVTQMTMGIMVKLLNDLYFRNWVNVIFEWLPGLLIMMCTFGYLVVMIFVKWSVHWGIGSGAAPSLISMLINMFMAPGSVKENEQFYAGQAAFQTFLVLVAAISVPMMLIPKPVILYMQHKASGHKQHPRHTDSVGGDDDGANSVDGLVLEDGPRSAPRDDDSDEEEEFEIGEVVVHQAIHTIEFVLGAISNTASYLRLWALSLAHAELSEVFWDLTLGEQGLSAKMDPIPWYIIKPPMIFFTFALWTCITMAVLMGMETLSAFLHALRLHWVEFQGKFYAGDGVQFVPFSFTDEVEE